MNNALWPCMTAWWAMFWAIIVLPTPLGPTRMMLVVSLIKRSLMSPETAVHEFQEQIRRGIPAEIPPMPSFDPAISRAPKRPMLLDAGVRMVKVRTGPEWRTDLATLAELKPLLGPGIELMVDGSETYTLPTALEVARALAELDVRGKMQLGAYLAGAAIESSMLGPAAITMIRKMLPIMGAS